MKIPKPEENTYSTAYLLNNTTTEGGRSRRLGMASLGETCVRSMWFGFRWVRQGSLGRRIGRIFSVGNACEEIVIKELTDIGITITDQQLGVNGWGGHIYGKIDGIAHNVPEAPKTPHLLEIKSMNDRNFQKLKKLGVSETQPKHYVQMQMYMGKLKLTRALYVVMNKNDSEIYIERIHFSEPNYKEFMSRAIDVVSCETTPPNLINDPKNFKCRFCDFNPVCYEQLEYEKNCRTCQHVNIENDGIWTCGLVTPNKQLTFEDQIKGCDGHRMVT